MFFIFVVIICLDKVLRGERDDLSVKVIIDILLV